MSRRRLSQRRTTSLTSMVGTAATEQPSNFKIVLTRFDITLPLSAKRAARAVRRKTNVKLFSPVRPATGLIGFLLIAFGPTKLWPQCSGQSGHR